MVPEDEKKEEIVEETEKEKKGMKWGKLTRIFLWLMAIVFLALFIRTCVPGVEDLFKEPRGFYKKENDSLRYLVEKLESKLKDCEKKREERIQKDTAFVSIQEGLEKDKEDVVQKEEKIQKPQKKQHSKPVVKKKVGSPKITKKKQEKPKVKPNITAKTEKKKQPVITKNAGKKSEKQSAKTKKPIQAILVKKKDNQKAGNIARKEKKKEPQFQIQKSSECEYPMPR